MIKMIATDMDGTFLKDDKTFDRPWFDRLKQKMAREQVHFVVASGNQYEHLLDIFQHDHHLAYIADNGAKIIDDGKTLAQSFLPQPAVQTALQLLQHEPILQGAEVILSGEKSAYTTATPADSGYQQMTHFYPVLKTVPKFSQIKDRLYKLALSWPAQSAERQEALLKEALPQLHVTSSGLGGIDIIAPKINKGVALRQLQQRWQITPAETAAFGDSNNDLELLHACDYSYAMKNANKRVKQTAQYQTQHDNNHDGVLAQMAKLI